MSERKVGSVTYQEVGQEYFEQRGLRRHAGVWSLWALGVAAVISGDFFLSRLPSLKGCLPRASDPVDGSLRSDCLTSIGWSGTAWRI